MGAAAGPASERVEGPADGLKCLQIDPAEQFEFVGGLNDHRRHGDHVRLLAQDVADFDRDWRAGESGKVRRAWRPHNDVGADALLARFVVVERSQGESHDQKDQSDLNSHGKNADDRTQGSMREVGDDHLVHRHILFAPALTETLRDWPGYCGLLAAFCVASTPLFLLAGFWWRSIGLEPGGRGATNGAYSIG